MKAEKQSFALRVLGELRGKEKPPSRVVISVGAIGFEPTTLAPKRHALALSRSGNIVEIALDSPSLDFAFLTQRL